MLTRISLVTTALALTACSGPTAPTSAGLRPDAAALVSSSAEPAAAQAYDGSCSFSRGVTTCVSTAQHEESSSHIEYSGCLYGPNGVPSSRQRSFNDVYLVTVTTTTTYHGRSDQVIDSQTSTSRQLERSTLVSDVCEPA
ncbi:MAG TPA: hypothetical protein VGG76_11420 [Gemmatimonadaceae bacterium]